MSSGIEDLDSPRDDYLEDSSKWSKQIGGLNFKSDIGLLHFVDDDEKGNRSSSASVPSIHGLQIREVASAHHGLDETASLIGLNSSASTTLGSSFRMSASGTLRLGNFMAINAGGIKRFGRQSKPSPTTSGISISLATDSRAKDIKQELVMLDVLGRGASGVVQRALHLPSLQLVAVKHVRMFDADVRNQAVRELKSLYANMVPLAAFRRHKSSLTGGMRGNTGVEAEEAFLGDTLILGGSFNSSIGSSSVGSTRTTDFGVSGAFLSRIDIKNIEQYDSDFHDSTIATYSAHLIRLYDAYVDPRASTVSIVIEYCGGGSLQDIVDAGGCRDERVLARMAAHSLRGLAYLHAHRQLHRDIKPGNILCSTNGDNYKLADFGIVRQLGEGTQDQYAKTWVGTMVYMSPERMSSSSGSGYSFPADIWSLGLSILSVALGRYPYKDIAYWELLSSIKDSPPPLYQLDEVYANSYIVSHDTNEGVQTLDTAVEDSHHILPAPSKEFIDFLEQALCRDPVKRPSAEKLLQHAFIVSHLQQKKGGTSPLMSAKGWIRIPPLEEVKYYSQDAVIGIPLSDSAERGIHCAKRPGAFSKLPVDQQESLVDGLKAMIYEIIADQGGVSHWSSFAALFGTSSQVNTMSHTLRHSLKLDEFSFNEYLLKRIGANEDGSSSPRLSSSVSTEGGITSSISTKSNVQLGIDDVRILSQQLGLPPLIVCAAFNDVISLKIRGLPIENPKKQSSIDKLSREDVKEEEEEEEEVLEEETDPILELLDADITNTGTSLGESFTTKFGRRQGVGPILEVDPVLDDDEEEDEDALDGIFFKPQGRVGRVGVGDSGSGSSATVFYKEGAHSILIREVPSINTKN